MKKFVVEQKKLLGLLSFMQPICTKRTALDTTSFILFQVGYKELVLKSTDLEISLQASCTLLESSIQETYSFLVSGKRIFDIVKELDGQIMCEINTNHISLRAEPVNLTLNIKEAQEFPLFPERIENLMHLDADILRKMFDSVAFLIPQNNANPALNGLLFELTKESLTMTTTDGHCLAQIISYKTNLAEPRTWLLPRRAIFELKKILESCEDATIFLGVCGNQLVFSGELFNFFTKLLSDPFPSYKNILDKNFFSPANIDRNKLIKTLRRSTCLLSGQFLPAKFSFDNDKLKVSINNQEVGMLDDYLDLKQTLNSKIELLFYSPYLLNGLQAFDGEDIGFFLKNSTSPIIFDAETDNLKKVFLVMPISPNSGK